MEDLPHISPQKPLGRSLPSASVQGANVQPKQSYLFPPCCVPSGPSHNLTKEAAVNVLENPSHTSIYAARGLLCASEGACSQTVEGSPLTLSEFSWEGTGMGI